MSLALEPANITAVANDVGTEVIFLRQLIAQGHPGDMAVGISTSGGSRNIVMALEEARKRKLTTAARLGYAGGEVLRRGLADFPSPFVRTIFPTFRKCNRPSTTSCGKLWRQIATS